jgi:hypothetical protein
MSEVHPDGKPVRPVSTDDIVFVVLTSHQSKVCVHIPSSCFTSVKPSLFGAVTD